MRRTRSFELFPSTRARVYGNTAAALALLLALALPALAVDGTVLNKTTGKPAAGVTVRLTALGEGGMKPIGRTETGPDGSFRFDNAGEGMFLVQANWQGVQYSQNLPPNAPKSGVEMDVWDVKAKLAAARVSQHLVFLESDGQQLYVTEMIIYQNDSLLTWYDARTGTARFFLPQGVTAGQAKARVTAPGGLPLERELTPQREKGVYAIDYPVKPGETRFELSYPAPATDSYSGRVLDTGAPVRLVLPRGMEATGDALQPLGKDPQNGFPIYSINTPSYKVSVTGAGTLRAATSTPQDQAEDDGPTIDTILPPGYERNIYKVLALCLAILVLGFVAMYLKGGKGSGRKA
ncbi:MAG: hypothetical protein ACLQBJ_03030 [Bryobacteraceae bacterium]